MSVGFLVVSFLQTLLWIGACSVATVVGFRCGFMQF